MKLSYKIIICIVTVIVTAAVGISVWEARENSILESRENLRAREAKYYKKQSVLLSGQLESLKAKLQQRHGEHFHDIYEQESKFLYAEYSAKLDIYRLKIRAKENSWRDAELERAKREIEEALKQQIWRLEQGS